MSDSLIVDRFGGINRFLQFLPPDYVKYIMEWCHLDLIVFQTGDILPNVLGYTYLSDTLSVMCTCKRWYAVTRLQTFWKRRIAERIQKNYSNIPNMNLFNPFAVAGESLQEQVQWIFRCAWIYQKKHKDGHFIYKKSHGKTKVSFFIEKSILIQIHRETNNVDEFWYFTDDKYIWSKRIRNDKNEIIERFVHYKSDDGSVFEGSARLFNNQIVPHGDGKWSFSDGTIMEGIGVAWMGEPRQPVKRLKT